MDDEAHDKISELLEAYALGALDERERAAVAAHLEACPECRRAVAQLGEAAHSRPAALAAASPLAPPAELERRVLPRAARR
jgi:anti-sigma factor RsiW